MSQHALITSITAHLSASCNTSNNVCLDLQNCSYSVITAIMDHIEKKISDSNCVIDRCFGILENTIYLLCFNSLLINAPRLPPQVFLDTYPWPEDWGGGSQVSLL